MRTVTDNDMPLRLPLAVLDGAALRSADAFGQACTASGAPWRLAGRNFDGSSSVITVPDRPALRDIFDGGGTLTCWLLPRSDGEQGSGQVLNKTANGDGGAWIAVREPGAGKVKLRFYQYFTVTNGYWTTVNTVVALGVWSFVAVTYNDSKVTEDPAVFVNGNGVAVVEGAAPSGVRRSDAGLDLLIGNRNAGDRTFDGLIGEYRFYRRRLGAAEIQSLYVTTNRCYR